MSKPLYQYTVTTSTETATRTAARKASAIASCKKAVKAAEVGTVGIVHYQDEKELLDAIVKFVKDEDGSIREEKFPLTAP